MPNKPYSYSYSPSPGGSPRPAPPPKKRRPGRALLLLGVLAVAIILVVHFVDNHRAVSATARSAPATASSPIPAAAPAHQTDSNLIPAAKLAAMSDTINGLIADNSNIDISVDLIDLNSRQSAHYGDSSAFTAASTTKVITAADFLHQVEVGQESLGEDIDGNTAQYELQQMIVISDDEAWDNLNEDLGYNQLQSYAHSLGLTSFQSQPNTVTSGDMALLLQKLYDGTLLDAADTQLLLGYMKAANYREYIVPAVPAGDTIYHKIGLYEDNVNDEAIITEGKKAFVIVIFTDGDGAYNWPARATLMQQITKAALATYF